MDIKNQQQITRLAEEIGEENVPVLLEIFLGELNTYISNLSQPESVDKYVYLSEISHALKSSAASFGADQLCQQARDIDARAKAGITLTLTDDLQPMLELLRSTEQAYQQLASQ
ncbi:quorum-sensing phosphorelay protein LuxU [Vibrio sp.]|uniref:quorum-sensing phosphorelay protein LuxU n=1 Tax=Vibrio sp. TaxID=678 RepID=UPI003D0AD0F8